MKRVLSLILGAAAVAAATQDEAVALAEVQADYTKVNERHRGTLKCDGDVYYARRYNKRCWRGRKEITLSEALKFPHKKLEAAKARNGYQCNNGQFGDPVPNYHKSCYCTNKNTVIDNDDDDKDETPEQSPIKINKVLSQYFESWRHTRKCNGMVLYGKAYTGSCRTKKWLTPQDAMKYGYKVMGKEQASKGFKCSNRGMGGDPVPGSFKKCWCLDAEIVKQDDNNDDDNNDDNNNDDNNNDDNNNDDDNNNTDDSKVAKGLNKDTTNMVNSQSDKVGKEVQRLINVRRTQANVPALKWTQVGADLCKQHNIDSVQTVQLSHDGFGDRANKFGKIVGSTGPVGENVLYNYASPQAVAAKMVEQWWNSKGHRENFMNPIFTHGGVSVTRHQVKPGSWRYWGCHMFFKPNQSNWNNV